MDTATPDPENEDRPERGFPASSTMTAPPPSSPSGGRGDLRRGGPHRMLAGVAVGLAEYLDVDPTLVRVGFVVLTLLGGLAVPLYLAGWLLIPEVGADQSVAEELLHHHRHPDHGGFGDPQWEH